MGDAKTAVKTDTSNNEAKAAVKTDASKNEAKADMLKKEKEYEIAMLRKNSIKLFGVTTSTFDGAMSRQTEPITIGAAKELIEKWKKGDAH